MEKVTLGNVEQWYIARGSSIENPILLFFHGGPGSPQTGAQHKYNRELENYFLVVNWDQRGCGKSYNKNVDPQTMNVQQLLSDAYELVQHLLERFNQKKVYIMGHSMGALIGVLFAEKYPEVISAYVGINQPINRPLEEEISYKFTFDYATKVNDKKAIVELEQIGAPNNGSYKSIDGLVKQRTYLTKIGGVTYKKNAMFINMHYLLSSHFNMRDRLNFFKGFSFTSQHLWEELCSYNIAESIYELDVPVYFVMGRHDKIVHDLVETFYQKVKAPRKNILILENSGHMACFEEPDVFNSFMINKVLKENEAV
ncbi:alpha/beta fold hydrolase [Metabacillus halosaccharovorans]|uniref:alpha/beta fold hydrolase n=1 Tax=Metabacillus halosaccharovorans TaxID=930124 RepID=UPI0015E0D5E5|nr:alpha/beta hydrolase [Metabacillus halosaccharovorans]MCM3442924.1 alpha/beta hydrolase [Metabacillus halosaccharovorans]